MTKGFLLIVISFTLLSSIVFSQSLKEIKPKTYSFGQYKPDNGTAFYIDFKNRQLRDLQKTGGALQKTGGAGVDLIFADWDWPFNSWQPPIMFAYDFTGDGVLDPFMVATDNQVQRVAIFGFVDDFGASSYNVYPGIDPSTTLPWRTGWNSHLLFDYNTGKAYVAVYDFLNSSGNINDHVWEVDLMSDPSTATQLTDSTTALEGGWARFALDGNGTFWEVVDDTSGNPIGIAASTDGGATFAVVDAVGSNDPKFWSTGFASDPMIGAYGQKISQITTLTRGGDLSELGYFQPDVTDPDSADGEYHWYSTDGGSSWQGEVITLDGLANIVNRPDYENYISSFDLGSFYVDPNGVTHVQHSGVNTVGLDPTTGDTISVYPLLYWNDRDKNWMSLEIPDVELYQYDGAISMGNAIGPAHPVLKADMSGQLLVSMWIRPQFSGAPGASPINTFTDPNEPDDYYYTDIYYAYSEDAGVTWSLPAVALSVPNEANYWAYIGAVEIDNGTARIHYTVFYDPIPGSAIVGQNSFSVGTWRYYTQEFLTVVSVEDEFGVVSDFQLEQNYPNPFNPSTTIKYSIPEKTDVTIRVYDVLGAEVATLVNVTQEAGSYEINFDASKLSSGMYIYKLNAGTVSLAKKMMLLK